MLRIYHTCQFCQQRFRFNVRHVLAECAAEMRCRAETAEARRVELESRLASLVNLTIIEDSVRCKRPGCGLPVARTGQHSHALDCADAARSRVRYLESKLLKAA